MFVGVRVTGPTAVGVTVKACEGVKVLNDSNMAEASPPPDGVMVIVPVKAAFGVTVKMPEAAFRGPPDGPVNVKLVAGAVGLTGLEALETALGPNALVAVTAQV